MTDDLFPCQPTHAKPRRAPRKLMHVCHTGGTGDTARFECGRCGHRSGWLPVWNKHAGWARRPDEMTLDQAHRGIPCPECNP